MGGKLQPCGATKPLHGFRWNLEYINTSWVWPQCWSHNTVDDYRSVVNT